MKGVKITRKQKSDDHQNDDGKTFYIRHDRFFTLLGSFLIFATFITKEAIGENLKDLVSRMDTAENLFVIREDLAFSLNNAKPWSPLLNGENPTNEQKMDASNLSQLQTEPLLEIARQLAKSLPDEKTFSDRADEIESDLSDLPRLKAPPPGSPPQKDYDTAVNNLYNASNDVFTRASGLRHEVFEQAKQLKQKREIRYGIAKWSSYFLFALGWGLTFYGQLSGKEEAAGKPA